MLHLDVVVKEEWDDTAELFVATETFTLELEHSLATLSKWESLFEKPFLGDVDKTPAETLAYIQIMIRNPEIPANLFEKLGKEHYEEIDRYINAKMTATWFRETRKRPSRDVITAEIIYHWMIAHNIWLEAEHWHLNKLLTLLKVCVEKNAPPKKMNRQQMLAERQKLNAQRKAELGTRG